MSLQVLVVLLGLAVINGASSLPLEGSDVGLNTVQMIENHGYPCETHYIKTDDNYILTVHRIPHGISNNDGTKKPVVFLMHGLVSSSADFVNMGPKRSLGYILADKGYDVWLGNARGNGWSRNHTDLDPEVDKEKFFDFSWHEIGYYDLPACIDYILNLKGDDSLYYIGHSQGTTAFIVLTSTRPEYNAKIKLASLMAPAIYMEHRKDGLISELGKYIDQVEVILKKYKLYELPLLAQIRQFAQENCAKSDFLPLCEFILNLIGAGEDTAEIDINLIPVIVTNAPSNAAVKQFIHYGQQIRSGGFSMFDYGKDKNKDIYGSETAPSYDLSKVTAPIAIYYGKNDGLVPYLDAQNVIQHLPNVANDDLIPLEKFNHIDFIFAIDVVDLLYNDLLDVMTKY